MSEKVNINIFDMLAAMAMDNVAAEQKAKASLRNLETLAMPGDPAIGLAERKPQRREKIAVERAAAMPLKCVKIAVAAFSARRRTVGTRCAR
jgi:ferric-dicitrate binding protein FerR (iron transport regulator)